MKALSIMTLVGTLLGTMSTAQAQQCTGSFDSCRLIRSAINYQIEHCVVRENGSNYQLYVDGDFKGNYRRSSSGDVDYLAHVIRKGLNNGTCGQRGFGGGGPVYGSNRVVEDARRGLIRNCVVRSNGQYEQLYVNGDFKGNYTDMDYLAHVINKGLNNGTCYYR